MGEIDAKYDIKEIESFGDAEKLTPKQITERLKGLPTIKIHCSVLGDQALRAAIKDYKERTL